MHGVRRRLRLPPDALIALLFFGDVSCTANPNGTATTSGTLLPSVDYAGDYCLGVLFRIDEQLLRWMERRECRPVAGTILAIGETSPKPGTRAAPTDPYSISGIERGGAMYDPRTGNEVDLRRL